MTSDLSWAPPSAVTRALLAGNATRRRLSAIVRRRVPSQDADDVVQSVLCDALAAEQVPVDPDELARWLAGVARHKVADHHRRAARVALESGSARLGDHPSPSAAELPSRPAPFEARALLRVVGADFGGDPR